MATLTAVKSGDWVSWRASRGQSRGRVVSVHTSSHVPAVPVRIEGSANRPAARVQVYAKVGDGWSPTETFVALHGDRLEAIGELQAPAPPEPTPTTEGVTPGSFDDIRKRVSTALRARLAAIPGAPSDLWVYVEDIGPSWVVFESDSSLWLCEYTDDGTTVTLGDPSEVIELTQYVPAQEAVGAPDTIEGRLLGAAGTSPDGGRVFRVRVIRYGESLNGRLYPEAVMRAAAGKYEGARAFDHHRTDDEIRSSTVRGIVGSYHNVTATAEGLDADLRLLPSAGDIGELLDRSLENQAQGLEPLVGISHDVLARYAPRITEGRRLQEATEIVSVSSADVVATPAAGGKVTRMVAAVDPTTDPHRNTPQHPKGNPMPTTIKQLLEAFRPADAAQRAELVRESAALLTEQGLTEADIARMVEAAPAAPAPAPAPTPSMTYGKGDELGRMIVERSCEAAKLDRGFAAHVLEELPATFTEADVRGRVEGYRRVLENAEKSKLIPSVPDARVTGDAHDKKLKALDAMIAGGPGGYMSLKEAYSDITGHQPRAFDTEDFTRRILRESLMVDLATGRPYESRMREGIERGLESVLSTTWGYVLGDSITRRMVALYQTPQLGFWRQIVSSGPPLADMRTQRLQRVGGYGVLPTVSEGAPYQALTSPANDTEITYAPTKRGGTEDLTWETIMNDDLRVVQDIPRRLGLAAAQTVFRFVFDFFTANAAVNDGVALFHASHSNTTATALSSSALDASRLKMRQQTAYGDSSAVLSLIPKFLLVPSTLEGQAFKLVTSAVEVPAASNASNIPNLHQGMTPIVLDYWSSQTQWYLVADPQLCPTLELSFLGGREDPELFVQSDPQAGSVWNADKITYKIRHVYGGNVLDYRAFQRGNS